MKPNTAARYAKELNLDQHDLAIVRRIIAGTAPLPLRCYAEKLRRYAAFIRETRQTNKVTETKYASV